MSLFEDYFKEETTTDALKQKRRKPTAKPTAKEREVMDEGLAIREVVHAKLANQRLRQMLTDSLKADHSLEFAITANIVYDVLKLADVDLPDREILVACQIATAAYLVEYASLTHKELLTELREQSRGNDEA